MPRKSKGGSRNRKRNRNKRRMRERMSSGDTVMHLSSEDVFQLTKPRYNPAAIGYGIHSDTSYNRAKQTASTRRLLREEGY